jgi:hypothetical protein
MTLGLHIEKITLTSAQSSEIHKIQRLFEKYGPLERAIEKLHRESIYECIKDVIGNTQFPAQPLLTIEGIQSQEQYKLIHFALTNVQGRSLAREQTTRIESNLIHNREGRYLNEQNLHQDAGNGLISLYCTQGGGITPTLFIDHTKISQEMDEECKNACKELGFWNEYTGLISENFFSHSIFDQNLSPKFEKAIEHIKLLTDACSQKITLKNGDAVFFDDNRLIHGRCASRELEEARVLLRICSLDSQRN